jgi:opacity protein-like surface antigen
MKKSLMSLMAAAVMGSSLYGGGDIVPVAPVPADNGCRDGFYVGGAVAIQRTYADDSDWFNYVEGQDKTVPIVGILGYKFNCYLAVEGRVSQSVLEEDYGDVLTYSIFLKPMYPVTESLNVYALIGYGVVDAEYTDGNTPAPANRIGQTIVDIGSFQWGLGLDYAINENWSVFLDYTRLMNEKSVSPRPLYNYDSPTQWKHISDDSINIGVLYHF